MKDIDVILIDNREFIINKVVNNYYYCTNKDDVKDICILKKVIEEGKEIYSPLSDDEIKEAIELFNKE